MMIALCKSLGKSDNKIHHPLRICTVLQTKGMWHPREVTVFDITASFLVCAEQTQLDVDRYIAVFARRDNK